MKAMMKRAGLSIGWHLTATALVLFFAPFQLPAQEIQPSEIKLMHTAPKFAVVISTNNTPRNILAAEEWRQIDHSVDRGLAFLASQQVADGSFPTLPFAQPGVTSLAVLAFMAHGHTPGNGPYGRHLERAIKYIVACQKKSGLIMLMAPDGSEVDRALEHDVGIAGTYDHAIASLTLAELYGMNPSAKAAELQSVIRNSLRVSLKMQRWPKERPDDNGGWRYVIDYDESDSDLSVTGWHLMFLRSARNAGFDVPDRAISDAVAYIRRSFDKQAGTFNYTINRYNGRTRGMAGAGILALGHAGFHDSIEAKRAADAILRSSFEIYNDNHPLPDRDRYHYSLFMCCQGMYQMGSPYWEKFFPRTVRAVLAHQQADGSWDAESYHKDRRYGNSYTTAMVILAMGAPNQLLPIFQR
jgi:hypothetical protein